MEKNALTSAMEQLVLRSLDQEAPDWNPTGGVSQLMTIWRIVPLRKHAYLNI